MEMSNNVVSLRVSVGTTVIVEKETFEKLGIEVAIQKALDTRSYFQDGECYTNADSSHIDHFEEMFGVYELQFSLPGGYFGEARQHLRERGKFEVWVRFDATVEINSDLLSTEEPETLIQNYFLKCDAPIKGGYIPFSCVEEIPELLEKYGCDDIELSVRHVKYDVAFNTDSLR